MNFGFGPKRSYASVFALCILAGCGMGAAGAPSVADAPGQHAASGARAWMAPGAARGALLYATGGFTCTDQIPSTCVYAYPSGKLVGTLDVGGEGLYSDRNGNVFFADPYNSTMIEYAHGGTFPIALLDDPGYQPHSCSVDPRSGDLAVMNACSVPASADYCDGPGNLAIYRGATGSPIFYQDAAMQRYVYGDFDADGNLFIGGAGGPPSYPFAFTELPRNGPGLIDITVSPKVSAFGQVQWDGSAITIEEEYPPAVYRLHISGTHARVIGTTHFRGKSMGIGPSWIHGNTIIVPYGAHEKYNKFIGFWQYPDGGKARKRIVNGFVSKLRLFSGVTISVAK